MIRELQRKHDSQPFVARTLGRWKCVFGVVCAILAALVAHAQFRGGAGGAGGGGGGWGRGPGRSRQRSELPTWEPKPGFTHDTFTFARIKYVSRTGRRSQTWDTDYPDSDRNFSFRLHQVTSLNIASEPKVLELTDPDLPNYPFIFMSGVGGLMLNDAEAKALRQYLLNGGFLMVDDFWGEAEWANFYGEIKKSFPEREPTELPLEHPIFHTIFDLKEKPQLPNIFIAMRYRGTGVTWEREDAKVPHYRGLFDDKNRLMAVICHNTDNGDGWEEEQTNPYYFTEFSEKKAYPLGINLVVYMMTH